MPEMSKSRLTTKPNTRSCFRKHDGGRRKEPLILDSPPAVWTGDKCLVLSARQVLFNRRTRYTDRRQVGNLSYVGQVSNLSRQTGPDPCLANQTAGRHKGNHRGS